MGFNLRIITSYLPEIFKFHQVWCSIFKWKKENHEFRNFLILSELWTILTYFWIVCEIGLKFFSSLLLSFFRRWLNILVRKDLIFLQIPSVDMVFD